MTATTIERPKLRAELRPEDVTAIIDTRGAGVCRMRSTARKRTSKAKPRPRSLFDKSEINVDRKWKSPPSSQRGENWAAVFVDPAQLGITVTIPAWMERRGQAK